MEILGIGINELVFIVIIALIILGPKDMQKAGRTIGRWLRSIVTSDGWKVFQQTSREIRTLPNRLIREANEELNKVNRDLNSAGGPSQPAQNSILPSRSRPLTSNPATPTQHPTSSSDMAEKTEGADREQNA